MKYLIIYDVESNDGYTFEDSRELVAYDDLVNAFEMYREYNPQMYEIARMIRPSEVIETLAAREADEQNARKAALAKLTASEIHLLGLTA